MERVQCPFCSRQIAVTKSGWLWYHRTPANGGRTRICRGSGFTVDLTDTPR